MESSEPQLLNAQVRVVEPQEVVVGTAVKDQDGDDDDDDDDEDLILRQEEEIMRQQAREEAGSTTRAGAAATAASPRSAPQQSAMLSMWSVSDENNAFFFSFMADHPWPFIFTLPILFFILIGVGWGTTSDKIESEVSALWVAQDGAYAADVRYAGRYGMNDLSASSYAALATSRDGENIITSDRLEEVRARMQAAEATTLEYKGETYTWADFCSQVLEPYESPCLRLSAMDLYKNARWTFTDQERATFYYGSIIQDTLIAPRLPRFGILVEQCTAQCAFLLAFRTNPALVGYPDVEPNPLLLVADVGNLEYNDPCRICIEDNYEKTITELHQGIGPAFAMLHKHVIKARDAAASGDARNELDEIANKLAQVNGTTVTTNDITEFYHYYVTRRVYGSELGVGGYLDNYALFNESIVQCNQFGSLAGLTCPPPLEEIDEDTAARHLLDHADNTFSSVTTSGAPFPFWSEGDGTGELLRANEETGRLYPVSGSGVNMSAPINSLSTYFAFLYLQPSELADPNSREWKDMVETNPLYAWFMAGLTDADSGMMCGNGNLTGTNTGFDILDGPSAQQLGENSAKWCTKYNVPSEEDPGPEDTVYTKQHFARMWYDLLLTSPNFLDVVQGQDDPYSYTLSTGCGYDLRGERFDYTNQTVADVLGNSSRLVYTIDEGTVFGAVDRSLLIGGAEPPVGEYSFENPLKKVTVLQTLYAAVVPETLITRLRHCKRPGRPVSLTLAEAEELLIKWKETMENAWNKGWDDEDDGEVQFVSFFDDSGAIGSTGRMLEAITLDNNTLMAISIIIIAVFSAAFLVSFDVIESRVLLAMAGVGLVVLAYFAGIGLGLILGIKINVSIAWTLPFVIIGLGVDDVYIVLIAIKKQGGYSKRHWLKAMKEVAVPVTMTSLVNACMFTVMNASDIGAIYKTSRVACLCIVLLYLSVLFCFPAICYLDLQRQASGRMDVLFCLQSANPPREGKKEDFRNYYLYNKFYKPIVLAENTTSRLVAHIVIFVVSAAIFAVGAAGITQRDIGLGLEDFFPHDNPAGRWATIRTEELASWTVGVNWGAIDYTEPDTQMKMIKMFEDIVATPNIAEEDTIALWMANFAIWTSRHCTHNFDRKDFEEKLCGRDQQFEDGTYCAGSWAPNKFGLLEKNFQNLTDSTCQSFAGGVCRPSSQMHPDDLEDMGLNAESVQGQSFCPVAGKSADERWSDEKFQFCLRRFRTITGGGGSRFALKDEVGTETECKGVFLNDEELVWPIPFSESPFLFAKDLYSHQVTLDVLAETRSFCDDNEEIHCWMSGIPFDYWSQYEGIFEVLLTLSAWATLAGFVIAFAFLFGKLAHEKHHPLGQIALGSLIGALLIVVCIVLTLVTVVGLSILVDVSLTGFSNLAFILSIGFTVEYSVHIVSRWLRANMNHTESLDRVDYTMSFLMLPTFMSFVSSTIGVVCLAFTDFDFNKVFFFRPLMIVMFIAYWFGCWFLPTLLIYLDFDVVKLGKPAATTACSPPPAVSSREQATPGVSDVVVEDDMSGKDEATPMTVGTRNSPVTFTLEAPSLLKGPDPPTGPTVLVQPPEVEEDWGPEDLQQRGGDPE